MLEEGLDKVALKEIEFTRKIAPDLEQWNEFFT